MNKQEWIKAVAHDANVPEATAKRTLDAALNVVQKALKKKDKVQITGFGTFSVRKRAARKGRNPHTGESIKIKASRTPVFKAGATFKSAV